MIQDEIIEMARQAGIDIGMWEKLSYDDDVFGYGIDGTHENLEAFAFLVAAKATAVEREACTEAAIKAAEKAIDVAIALEREACAKVCDVLAVHPEYASEITKLAAQAIRNRGQV